MAPSCAIPNKERYARMTIGSVFVVAGFLLRRDAFAALALVIVGSAMAGRASLGY
jgi:hypothetical protein